MSTLSTAALTGLAGFDPAPSLIALVSLAAGTRRRTVGFFILVLVLGTATWGIIASAVLGPLLTGIDWWRLARSGTIAALIELVIGAALISWRILRRLGPAAPEPVPSESSDRRAGSGLLLVALGFIAVVMGDPAFDVQVVAAARLPWPEAIAGWLVWSVCSQILLIPVVILLAFPRDRVDLGKLAEIGAHIRRRSSRVVTPLIVTIGLLLMVDAGKRLLTGTFLIA